jgi:hypothetical protein
MVVYNAIQKVFRARYDELRSNVNFSDYTDMELTQLNINATRPPFESLLTKTAEFFADTAIFKVSPISDINSPFFTNINNFPLFDFPFLMAQKSDAGRHI